MAGKEVERRRKEQAQRESSWRPLTVFGRKPLTKAGIEGELVKKAAEADKVDNLGDEVE